jgi:hypothetical protein
MRVELSPQVLEQPAAFRHLTAIAWLFTDGRHKWVVNDPEPIVRSAWMRAEGEGRRRILIEDARTTRSEQRADLHVLELGQPPCWRDGRWEVPADVAEDVLAQPLSIVVENAKCDGAFLKLVALRAGARRLQRRLGEAACERLRARWTNPLGDGRWFSVRHGAGNNTRQQVELHVEAEPTVARRLFVMVDSDRSGAGAPLGGTAGAVQQTCQRLHHVHGPSLRLSLRILRKREVENYLPPAVLRATSQREYERWCQLTDDEKDYGDLKKSFGKDLWKVLTEEHHQGHFHEQALRERAGEGGRELDEIVEDMLDLL